MNTFTWASRPRPRTTAIRGLQHGLEVLAGLGLTVEAVPANDPFFGRLGTMLAANQLEEALKIEIVTPVCSTEHPTAIMSANCHRDHFGAPFGIETAAGTVAHSACVAVGVDRVTLALLHTHGLDPLGWPSAVSEQVVAMRIEVLGIDPARYVPHPLHTAEHEWTETNCYVDLWIEMLHALGLDPVAGAAFSLSSDFEGDQWAMFKFPTADLRTLFGLEVAELNVWRPVVDHIAEQLGFGRLLTVDVDAWYLPDTAGVTYRVEHQKTTIAPQMLDVAAGGSGTSTTPGTSSSRGTTSTGFCALVPTPTRPRCSPPMSRS